MMEESKLTYGRVFYILVLAVTFAAALGWQISAPVCSDDWVYSLAAPEGGYSDEGFWNAEGEAYRTAGQVWESVVGHARLSNARLTNLIYIPVQLVPHAVLKVICGLLVWMMFAGMYVLSVPKGSRARGGLLMVAVAAFWTVFPWYDSMQSSDFIFNYPLVTVVMLVWLSCYLRMDGAGLRRRVLFAGFTFVVSLFHEGFTIPMGFFVFTSAICGGKELRKYRLCLCALMIVAVGLMASMGTGERVGMLRFSLADMGRFLRWSWLKILFDTLPCIIALAAIVGVRFFARRIPREEFRRFLWPCAGAIVGGILMCMVLQFFSRAVWGADVFAFLVIMRLCSYLRVRGELLRGAIKAVGVLFICAYVAWTYELVRWQKLSAAGQESLVAAVSPRGSLGCDVAYASLVHADDIPFYLLDIPVPVEEVMSFNNRTFAKYWTRRGVPALLVLPESMKGLDPDSIMPIAGNARFRGVYPYLFMDRPYKGHIAVKAGVFRKGCNPVMKLVAELKPLLFGGEEGTAHPYVETKEVMMPDSSVWYMILPECGPRTFRYREIMRIDTIDGGK
ncbi:MAG: hypothetical protein K2L96_06605 [Muribaculaceae bacterium]|nr:hypothetical protein [Muribaculaceae bacterium]